MFFYTSALAADQWMWCVFIGIGTLLWGQVCTQSFLLPLYPPVTTIVAASFISSEVEAGLREKGHQVDMVAAVVVLRCKINQ